MVGTFSLKMAEVLYLECLLVSRISLEAFRPDRFMN